jgi:hypothetical protein
MGSQTQRPKGFGKKSYNRICTIILICFVSFGSSVTHAAAFLPMPKPLRTGASIAITG